MAVFYHWRGDPAKIRHIINDYHFETIYELPNCPSCYLISSVVWSDHDLERYGSNYIDRPNYFLPEASIPDIGTLIELCKRFGGSGTFNNF